MDVHTKHFLQLFNLPFNFTLFDEIVSQVNVF